MFKRILVPLDGSLLAEAALAPAFELAQRFGGDVVLLRAVPPDELEFSSGLYALSRVWEQQEQQAGCRCRSRSFSARRRSPLLQP